MRRHLYDSEAVLCEDYISRGWTDGLPIVAPTPERVEAFLAASGLDADEVLGMVTTREVTVRAGDAAVNAVMAGCLPSYFGVVAAAVRAHLHEMANCHSTTGTLSGAVQVVIVNGPVRLEIGVESGPGCFGPGFRANATIGRALRLIIRNVCRAVPGGLDRASFSSPMRYSFCFAENEEASDWMPLHVQRGFSPGQSTATVHSSFDITPARAWDARGPEEIVDAIVSTMRKRGIVGDPWLGDRHSVVIVIGPEHHRFFTAAGWSKADIQAAMWPRITAPATGHDDKFCNTGSPECILFVAAGGPGMSESWVLFPHLAWPITCAVERSADRIRA